MVGALRAGNVQSDTFGGNALNSFWSTYSPNPTSSIMEGGGHLTLDASPLDGGSDWWSGSNYNAPVIFQTSSQLNSTNWTATVDLNFSVNENYVAAGIVIGDDSLPSDPASLVLADVDAWGNNANNGTYGLVNELKLTKVGDIFSAYLSNNGGGTWYNLGSFSDATIDELGLYSSDEGWNGQEFPSNAQFSNFVFTPAQSGVPDSATSVWLALAAFGSLLLVRRRACQ